jgi:hypothetical protein
VSTLARLPLGGAGADCSAWTGLRDATAGVPVTLSRGGAELQLPAAVPAAAAAAAAAATDWLRVRDMLCGRGRPVSTLWLAERPRRKLVILHRSPKRLIHWLPLVMHQALPSKPAAPILLLCGLMQELESGDDSAS